MAPPSFGDAGAAALGAALRHSRLETVSLKSFHPQGDSRSVIGPAGVRSLVEGTHGSRVRALSHLCVDD
eukprot:gene47283-13379_t